MDEIGNIKKKIVSEYAAATARAPMDALDKALQKNGISTRYSFFELKENMLCILFEENKWVLAYSERGQKNIIASYEDIMDACERIISLEASDKKDRVMQDFTAFNSGPYWQNAT